LFYRVRLVPGLTCTTQPVCAESAVKQQLTNQPEISCFVVFVFTVPVQLGY